MNLFEVKVSYSDATMQTVKQIYLVDAMTFTEAEAKAIKAATPYSTGGIEIITEKKSRVEALLNQDDSVADRWYRGKVAFITLDNDKEKRTFSSYFIKAENLSKALGLLEGNFKDCVFEWEIASVSETQIVELIK